jgi:hypothetical protein
VAFHINKLGYSHADMAKLLLLTVSEFQEMYQPEGQAQRPQLRVVK